MLGSGVATPGYTRAFAQASENVVHFGTSKNTAFYDTKCSPYHRNTPNIADPYASYTFKSPTLTTGFSLKKITSATVVHVRYYY